MSTHLVEVDSAPTIRVISVPAPRTGSTATSARRIRPHATTNDSMEVQLTRRGRLVLLIAVLVVAFGVLTLVSPPAASTGHPHHGSADTVVVEPGQTLWDIAAVAAPGSDPREVIAEIVDLNALADAGAIRVGQPLSIPAR